ncbi:MAG TPA: penicillin-binding protein activator [Geopsychrobacteraceae bacterium]|nr:penicillin-binding protein activator [Geopsychrobacteraceae bacterium]
MKRILSLVIVLALITVLSGVTLAQTGSTSGSYGASQQLSESESAFARGVASFHLGDHDQALVHLRRFVLRQHDSKQIPEAYTYLGRIFILKQHYTDALLYLERIPEEQRSPQAQLLIGFCLVFSGEGEVGRQLLLSLVTDNSFSSIDSWRLYYGLAVATLRQEKLLQALVFFDRAITFTEEPEPVLEEVHQLLHNRFSTDQLEEAAFMFHNRPIGLDARLQLARQALARKDDAQASRYLQMILDSPTMFPYRKDAAELLDRFSPGSWLQQDAIGVLLPLSGRYSAFGELVKRSMDLALELHNANSEPIRFIYQDTEGEAETARRATATLTNEERVMAIAGPLTGSAAIAAADQAQKDGTPLLSLSQRANLPAIGNYIFRNSLTSRLQVRALARYAIEDRGMTSFGVMYPENRLGREMAQLFAEEVLKLGGLVTDEQSYTEDATDFRHQIKLFIGEDPDSKEEISYQPVSEEEKLEDLFLPDLPEYPAVTFDALFIPDYADRVGLIAPQLAFYGIEDFPLLGINGWNSPELVQRAGRFVQNAVFVDGFFPGSDYPFVREFVDLYLDRYGEEPSILEAQAFDIANILIDQIARKDLSTRETVRLSLSQLQNYPGVTGATSFDFTGEADKILFLLQVQKGRIVQMN